MTRPAISRLLRLTAAAGLLLAGCSTNSPLTSIASVPGMSGSVHGGQQPISGAAIQLYAVGTSGDGAASTALLTLPVLSDANGNFNISGLYTCPTSSTLVYITAVGGSPAAGVTNPQSALLAALGACGSLTPSTFINLNELTTVAAVYTLAPYMSSFAAIGSGASDTAALAAAFTTAGYFVNTTTGTAPGTNLPAGYSVNVPQLNTLADLLGACINSSGGVSGDSSVCGTFFALTLPTGAPTAPTDAIAALLNLANHPALNTAPLYNLIPPSSPFQPILPVVPADLSLHLVVSSLFAVAPASLTFSPVVVNFTQPTQFVTVTNGTPASVSINSATISGVNASDFAIVPTFGPSTDCHAPVPANSTCSYQISFTPSGTGARQAYLVINNGSPNPVIAIPLSGTASIGTAGPVTLTPSTAAVTYDPTHQLPGTNLTLTNTGTNPLTINGIVLSSFSFGQFNTCGTTLGAGASCTITVMVTGASAPPVGTLTVIDDAASGPQTVNLTYAGALAPNFPSTVDFGHVALGGSLSDFIEIVGPGTSGAYTFSITGPNASDFATPQTCNYNYRNGIHCYINFTFAPTGPGTRMASFVIAGFPPYTLTGIADPTGPDFDLYQPTPGTPPYYAAPIPSINVGGTVIATTAPQSNKTTFTINNTGTIPLSLKTPVVSGPNAADFAVDNPTCSTGCKPQISFTPSAPGSRSATITYTDSTGAVTRTLSVTGTGLSPNPTITATGPFVPNIFFTNIPIGTAGAAQTITITAYQNDPVQVTLVPTSGTIQPFLFVGPSSCPSTPCQISITYAPKSTADDFADIYITATDTLGSSSANIQAIGRINPLAYYTYTPHTLTFKQPAGAVTTQTITISSVGTAPVPMAVSLDYPPNPFTLANHCPASIPAGTSCAVDVTYAPTVPGTTDASSITLNGPYAAGITLSGTSQ